MKKLVCLALVVVLTLAMAVCASAEWKFERKIDIVCPWGVGGGADSTIRPMAQQLQEILGVPVEVVNVEGGGGVSGVEYTYKQPADGYTFMLGTQSLFIQDMMDTTTMNFKEDFEVVDVLVHSVNVFCGSKKWLDDHGVSNWSELEAYIAEHPYEVPIALLSAGGVDGAGTYQATEARGLYLMETPYTSGSDANSALVGGHCALYLCGADEVAGLIESGDIVPLLVLMENRMNILPDVPCTGELGIDSYMAPWRAIFAVKGTPEEAIDAMVAAVEEARTSDTWQNFITTAGYDERPVPEVGEALDTFVQSEWKGLRDYMVELDTLAKDYDDLK